LESSGVVPPLPAQRTHKLCLGLSRCKKNNREKARMHIEPEAQLYTEKGGDPQYKRGKTPKQIYKRLHGRTEITDC